MNSKYLSTILSLCVFTCLAADSAVHVVVSVPTIVGFFPPVSQADLDHDDGGIREGIAHVQFALEDVEKCLSPRKLSIRFEQTRSLDISDRGSDHRLDFPPDWFHAVGIVLVSPGTAPVVVYATAGPSSLSETAPQAAWKLFSEPKCKRYEDNGAA
jgi:hypothetical protein